MYDFLAEIRNYSIFVAFIYSPFRVTEEDRSEWPTLFLLNVFTALKGTHLYIFIWFQVNVANPFSMIQKYEHLGMIKKH